MTVIDSESTSRSNVGSVTLVELPARVDLPQSGLLDGIREGEAIEHLNLLAVLYDAAPDEWVQSVLRTWDERPNELGIVSVGDGYRSTVTHSPSADRPTPSGPDDEDAPDLVTPLEDPADLTGLGLAINRYLGAWTDDARTVLLFDSVSGLLDGVETTDAIRFLHTLRHRIIGEDGVGFLIVHPELHDEKTLSMCRTLADEVVTYDGVEHEPAGEYADDPLMEALADGTYRRIVELLTLERTLSVSGLAARVEETDPSVERGVLEVALHHTHLPKLADRGVVRYDSDTRTVELAVPVERVQPYLRFAREQNRKE